MGEDDHHKSLNDIARAQGMTQLAKATGIGREGLYEALSTAGNPEVSTILKVIKALKINLHASAAEILDQTEVVSETAP